MPAKEKHVHNTRSVTGVRATSPLTVKLKNNLAATKKKPALKSVVKVVKNDKQNKKKHVSFHEDCPAQPVDITPPRQTAFADAMEKWRQSMISAVNSMPSPLLENSTDASAQTTAQNNNLLKQMAGKGNSGNQAVLVAVHSPPDVVAPRNGDSRPSQGCSDDSGQPGEQPLPPDDLEMDDINVGEVLSMFEVDNLLPPLPGRPDHGPVADDSAPQAALDLLTVRDMLGKGFRMFLSKHVPANIKRRVWANKYVDFTYLIESDPTEETPYQFVQSTTNPGTLTLAQAKSSSKINGWVSWNKALRIFTEIYCMKYPIKCMQLLQYVGILNNLSSWFPFDQVYRYDKEFRADLDWYPNKDWHIIDTQLWSMALHGVHTLPNQGNPKQYTFKPKNPRRPLAGMDNQFKNCFDHN